jgi:hypothetical protein
LDFVNEVNKQKPIDQPVYEEVNDIIMVEKVASRGEIKTVVIKEKHEEFKEAFLEDETVRRLCMVVLCNKVETTLTSIEHGKLKKEGRLEEWTRAKHFARESAERYGIIFKGTADVEKIKFERRQFCLVVGRASGEYRQTSAEHERYHHVDSEKG